jgi:YfiH family protein
MSTAGIELVRPPIDGPCGAAFTTRTGGVSRGPYAALNLAGTVADAPADVRTNRELVCRPLGIDARRVQACTQVHGTAVHRVLARAADGAFLDPTYRWPEGDGLVSDQPGVAVSVFGADCLPVLLWRRDRPLVAAVHAGWRGLVDGILERAVDALGGGAVLGVAVGAGIGPCCYPVSQDVRDRFAVRFGAGVVCGEAVDLADAAVTALIGSDVPRSAVWVLGGCTACDRARWFSFRRDGAPTGRQAGLIWPVG